MEYKPATYFSDGVAFISGAGSGIGRATALTFARDGCVRLMLGDDDFEKLKETKSLISSTYPGARVEIASLDISDEAGVDNFFAQAVKLYGRIDFAANVASIVPSPSPTHRLTGADFDRVFKFNQRGTFFCQRALLRIMIKQDALPGFESRGSIVNVTSLCGTAPMLGAAAYSATQGAGIALTKTDALDYGPDKIRVNSVAPGYIAATDVASPMGNEHNDWFAERTAWKRNGKPQDVANVVCWLSSPQAVFITGLNVPVDGGLNLYNRD